MKLSELKALKLEEYKKNNNLEQSYISDSVLWQSRPLLPTVKIVGKDGNGNVVFYEETSGSLQKRHYGKSDVATSYNLLYNDGIKTRLVTKEYLKNNVFELKEEYNIDKLVKFIENNNNRFNALDKEKTKPCQFKLTDEEHEIVKDFIKKMRKVRGQK